jgi:hypothetical protein
VTLMASAPSKRSSAPFSPWGRRWRKRVICILRAAFTAGSLHSAALRSG